MKSNSWIIRNKTTGAVIMETWNKKLIAAINTDKYEAIPAFDYLVNLSKSIKLTNAKAAS